MWRRLSKLSISQKEQLARIIRQPVVRSLMALAVRVVVARHRAGVTVVCFDGENRILMLRHVFHPVTPWDLPGGWLERDESPEDGVLRELREETGLIAELGPVVRLTRETTPSHLVITYMARLNGNAQETVLSSEILEARWFAADELPPKVRPSTRLAIETAVEKLPGWSMMEQVSDV